MNQRHEAIVTIAIVVAFAMAPVLIQSGFVLNLLVMVLLTTLMAQAWNIVGGFGGQISFGQAAFFGTGAYAMAVLQVQAGLNAWLALPLALAASAGLAAVVGIAVLRAGLRGSYFSLVTLAIAEILRVLANSVSLTGAGAGIQLPLQARFSVLQFVSKTGYLYMLLACVAAGFAVSCWLRHSRYGAYLLATRDNEHSARALGIDVQRVKLGAICLSAVLMASAGVFYVQYFHYIDPSIAYGTSTSIEALVAAVIGGTATLFGPLLGALLLQGLGELTHNLLDSTPGTSMVIYGVLLIVMVRFLPRGVAGALKGR